ncbi:MAG TPA: multiheme c-type cytochrome [Myxococcota bacterium]|nr:multiheme c-type cytochrome [Myxococcota bacterium]
MKRSALVALVSVTSIGCSSSQTPEPTRVADSVRVAESAPSSPREATLFLMADLNGVLRPCGCTVDLQKGGFDRLIPYLESQRQLHPGSELVHAGPIFYEDAAVDAKKKAQRERQVEVAADLIAQTKVALAGATAVDEVASGGRLGELATRAKVQLTAANLSLPGTSLSRYEVRTIGGIRFGLFALAASVEGSEVKVGDPETAAREVIAELGKKSDVVVLLSALGLRETKRLVRKVEGVHFAIAGGMGEHPSWSDEAELVGATRVMQFHREGRYLGRLTVRIPAGVGAMELVDASAVSDGELALLDERIRRLEEGLAKADATGDTKKSLEHHLASVKDERRRLGDKKVVAPGDRPSFSFTQTPLNWDLPQEPKVVELMKAFDEELARINIANAGTLPEPKPGQAVYVGTEACFECHAETKEFWRTNEHAGAWATLEGLGKTFDAECVSCHVTGYGEAGGALVGKTAGRENVQCESCHGPGSLHAADGEVDKLTVKPVESTCVTCHNKHHSPTFAFGSYRERLLVPGHGKPL